VKEPACRVNVTKLAPAAIVTADGALSWLLTVDKTTLTPPAGAFFVNVTVQVLEVDGDRVAGLQTREDTRVGGTRAMVSFAEAPL
jgi:hypothetical protein